jgi:DNA-binding response OmpR family regulator
MRQTYTKKSSDTVYQVSVLLVTHSFSRAASIKRWLENHNCHVTWPGPNSHHLTMAGQNYFDLIVVDVESPHINSRDVYRRLRSQAELATVPVVVLTYRPELRDTAKKLEMEPIFYLSKNASPQTALPQIVEEVGYITGRYM